VADTTAVVAAMTVCCSVDYPSRPRRLRERLFHAGCEHCRYLIGAVNG